MRATTACASLAVAMPRRLAVLPEVPTLEEAANLPGFEMSAWQGIVVPAATPKEIVARLNAEVNKAVQNPDLRAAPRRGRQRAAGRAPPSSTPPTSARSCSAGAKS